MNNGQRTCCLVEECPLEVFRDRITENSLKEGKTEGRNRKEDERKEGRKGKKEGRGLKAV
jgi:hypothetical protein